MTSFALEPLLARQRALYDQPPGRERFERYLRLMLGTDRDLELPLSLMNPMGKPHVAARLDQLLDLDAESVAERALEEASTRLAQVSGLPPLKLGLVVVDDAGGGWTDRYTTEMAARFGRSGELARGWITALLWTGELPDAEAVREEVLTSVFRAAHRLTLGSAETLGARMLQEGRAAAFGRPERDPEAAELAASRRVIERHLDSTAFPIQFACLYGDEVAESLGYRPLGVPARAGYRLAADDARTSRTSPADALR